MAEGNAHLERELKLVADLDFELPDLRPAAGGTRRLPEQHLITAYFDTPDLRLWDRGLTLRHRAAGDGAPGTGGTWMLKLPAPGPGSRLGRTELSWPGAATTVPREAIEILTGVIRHARLARVVELATTRRRFELGAQDGPPWGELDDDVVRVVEGLHGGQSFREMELTAQTSDADEGVDDQAAHVVHELQRAGAHVDPQPKLARALALPPVGRAARLSGGASVGSLVRSAIRDGLERLLDHDYRLRIDPRHPQARDVHRVRVATRRLRAHLQTFDDALDPVWLHHTRVELRWLGDALGAVRDRDVLAATLGDRAATAPPGVVAVLAMGESERLEASDRLAEALGTRRYLLLLDPIGRRG